MLEMARLCASALIDGSCSQQGGRGLGAFDEESWREKRAAEQSVAKVVPSEAVVRAG